MSQDNQQPEVPEEFKDFITEAVSDGEIVYEQNLDADERTKGRDWPQFDENENNAEEDDEDDNAGSDDEDVADDDDGADDDTPKDDELEADTSDDDDEGEDKPKKRRKKGARARIAEITAARRAAEDEAASLKAENEALKAGKEPAKKEEPKPVEIDTSDLTEPNPADFDFGELDAGYMEKMAEHKAEIAFRRREAKAEADRKTASDKKAADDAAATLEKNFLDNVVEPGKELFDDFDDVVIEGGKAGEYQLTPTLVSLISESDAGAKIMYHFASNPDEASKVANLSVERQAAYFGRMEARFAPSQEDERKSRRAKPSKAPKPPRAKSRGAGAGKKDNAGTTDFAAFERMVNAKG